MSTKTIGDRTYKALTYLYQNSKEIQDVYLKNSHPINEKWHAKELGTVKISTARGAGHSTAIVKFLLAHKAEKWAVVALNLGIASRMFDTIISLAKEKKTPIAKAYPNYIGFKHGEIFFMSGKNFDEQLRGRQLDGIIIDGAFSLSPSQIDQLYKTGEPCMFFNKYRFFIFVQ